MATNVTAEWTNAGPDGRSSTTTSANISVNDVTVNTTPNATGGWNTATVTADVAPSLVFQTSDGVPPGRYEKFATGKFRRNL
jgi:hypothetical protein